MVAILKQMDEKVPVRKVTATRGKWLRAEPVAALYAEGRVAHVGRFEKLEEQMMAFAGDGRAGGRSPDRLDALVWALTDLKLDAAGAAWDSHALTALRLRLRGAGRRRPQSSDGACGAAGVVPVFAPALRCRGAGRRRGRDVCRQAI